MGNDPVSTRPIGGGASTPTYSKATPATRTDSDFQRALSKTGVGAAVDPARGGQASSPVTDTVRITQQTMLSGLAAYSMAAQASPAVPGYQRPAVRVGDNVTTKNDKSEKGAFRLSPSRELQGRTAYAKALQTQTAVSQTANTQSGDTPATPVTSTAPAVAAEASSPAEQEKVADRSSINIVL
ncbi:hypothetical protein [Nitrospirillum iridis]|uniref:Uncharacterized protein n=1 Tax=Nitrospirillum iridis TaxID=765888 RepID=A0A7X0B0P1_9PROT|nr:hypothetical protein [Nitrospirillum iridis]MBB6253639.1 hypothetical protein [Nitrospirillum iridis]